MTITLAEFNALDTAAVRSVLDGCLDIDDWVVELARQRPFASLEALQHRASEASAKITWRQVATALDRHPRIGDRAKGADAEQSAAEQAGVQRSQVDDFAVGNRTYEAKFGHIFLICAAGLSGSQMLAALRQRIGNDPETERAVVISELRKIAHLRLAKAVTA